MPKVTVVSGISADKNGLDARRLIQIPSGHQNHFSIKVLEELWDPMGRLENAMWTRYRDGLLFPFEVPLHLANFLYLGFRGEEVRRTFSRLNRVANLQLFPTLPDEELIDSIRAFSRLTSKGFHCLSEGLSPDAFSNAKDSFVESRKLIWDFVLGNSPETIKSDDLLHDAFLHSFLLSFSGEYCCMQACKESYAWFAQLFGYFRSMAEKFDSIRCFLEDVMKEELFTRTLLSCTEGELEKLGKKVASAGKDAVLVFEGPEFGDTSEQELSTLKEPTGPRTEEKPEPSRRENRSRAKLREHGEPQNISQRVDRRLVRQRNAEENGLFNAFLFKPFGYDKYLVLRTEKEILEFFSVARPGDEFILKVIRLSEDEYNKLGSFKGF